VIDFSTVLRNERSRDRSVYIETKLPVELRKNCVSVPMRFKRFLPSPKRPDEIWGPPNLLLDRDLWCFNRRYKDWRIQATIHGYLMPNLTTNAAIPHNSKTVIACTGTTLYFYQEIQRFISLTL
jgi:hypothetical protein